MMTSATEVLRRMLDERGVEWWPMHDAEAGYREDRDTEFLVYGCKHVAHEWGCRLQVDMLTPEQAIAATLGEVDEGCYLMRDGKKFPVELDYGFVGIMPIVITVGGFRYLLEVPNGE